MHRFSSPCSQPPPHMIVRFEHHLPSAASFIWRITWVPSKSVYSKLVPPRTVATSGSYRTWLVSGMLLDGQEKNATGVRNSGPFRRPFARTFLEFGAHPPTTPHAVKTLYISTHLRVPAPAYICSRCTQAPQFGYTGL